MQTIDLDPQCFFRGREHTFPQGEDSVVYPSRWQVVVILNPAAQHLNFVTLRRAISLAWPVQRHASYRTRNCMSISLGMK